LTNLDVSDNPQLTGFHCRGNQLTSLDISNCLSLRELDCSENQIISLDVSNLPELTQLECAENQLESLDVSTNLNLEFLACSDNQLDNLDISNNPHLMVLSCSENQLDSLDVSNNPQLGGLWCRGNQISSLDLSNNSQLFELFWQDFFFMLFGLRPELDISDMPTLYKVCVDSVPFPPPEYDSLLISNGSPNVHFTTNCSLDFEPPVISSAIVYTDTITVISSEDGVIYLVPADTEKDLRILREVCMDSVETLDMAGSIHLEGIGNDTYWLYARDTSYNISEPKALTITGVGFDQFMARQVRIYPNPVNDLITIQTCQPGSYIFEVTSVNGQLVRNGIFTGSSQQVDLSTLHKGIYFVTIKSSAYVVTRKVIVQ
jgi:hypothetical protein